MQSILWHWILVIRPGVLGKSCKAYFYEGIKYWAQNSGVSSNTYNKLAAREVAQSVLWPSFPCLQQEFQPLSLYFEISHLQVDRPEPKDSEESAERSWPHLVSGLQLNERGSKVMGLLVTCSVRLSTSTQKVGFQIMFEAVCSCSQGDRLFFFSLLWWSALYYRHYFKGNSWTRLHWKIPSNLP